MNAHETGPAGGRPIFVFGCGRSGTSLLSRILNQHPNIAVPFESHLFINGPYGPEVPDARPAQVDIYPVLGR